MLPVFVLTVVVVVALLAPYIAPHDPIKGNLDQSFLPPMWYEGGISEFPFGTDQMGRDVLSRLMWGARISLLVGVTTVLVCGFVASVLAMFSGFTGGWVDSLMMRITDIALGLPFILVALVLVGLMGPSLTNLMIVLVALGWAGVTRVLRGEVLKVKELDFVKLAIVAGCSKRTILVVHIFPNILNTLVVLMTLQVGAIILAEAALSFLGMGVPPTTPTWGIMVSEGRLYIATRWWLVTLPGVAIMFVVLSFNLLGDWLRDFMDPMRRRV